MPSVAARITPEEYLERERQAEIRSEYRNGEIVAMAGASFRHGRIIRNLMFQIHSTLRNGSCEVFSTDLRLGIRAANLYTYPDVMVICGQPESADDRQDIVLNPVILIEVLSKSTQTYDRGEKFAAYRTISSLMEYLTVAQDEIHVEQNSRLPDQSWLLKEFRESSGIIKLESIAVELLVSDVYEKVEFTAD